MILTFTLTGGIVLLSLVLLLLIGIRKKGLAHYFLITIFCTLWCFFLSQFAEMESVDWLYTICFILSDSIGFFLGPLFLLFIKDVLAKGLQKRLFALHFIPFTVHWIFITIPLGMNGDISDNLPAYFSWIWTNEIALSGLENVYFLGYILYAYYLLNQHLKNNLYSINLHWSLQLLLMTIAVTSIDLIFVIYELIFGELNWYSGYVTIVSSFLAIFYLTFYAFKNGFAAVLSYQIITQHAPNDVNGTNERSIRFSEDKVTLLKAQLQELLIEQKRYQDSNLSLGQLATEMNVSIKTLSQFINHELDTNFYALINAYRIEDVKQKLVSKNYTNYTIMGIANEAGFKSKTSFYRLFKKATNMSPAAYQKSVK